MGLDQSEKNISDNYLFFANRISETTKKGNITNILLDKEKNNINVIYKNKNLKVLLKNSLLDSSKIKKTNNDIDDFLIKNFKWLNLFFLIIIAIAILTNLSSFPHFIVVLFMIFFIIVLLLSIAISANPILGIFTGILFISIIILASIKYIFKLLIYFFTWTLSFLSNKIFQKDYFSILLFKLSNIYNIKFFQEIIKKRYKNIVKIDYDETYLSSNYILDTDNINLLYSDNNIIEFPEEINKTLKYKIWKEIYSATIILSKFYNTFDKIKNIIEKKENEKQEEIKELQKGISKYSDPRVKTLELEYKKYVEVNKEIDKITKNLRKVYKQPENLQIFDKIDNLIFSLNKNSLNLKVLNEKIKILYKKLNKVEKLLNNFYKTNNIDLSKNLISFYRAYFNILIWWYNPKSLYIKNKIIEMNDKIDKKIKNLYQSNNKIRQEIKESKTQYEQKINGLLENIKLVSKEISNKQSEIRLLEKELKKTL